MRSLEFRGFLLPQQQFSSILAVIFLLYLRAEFTWSSFTCYILALNPKLKFLEMIKKTILSLLLFSGILLCSAQVNVEVQLISSGTQSFSISEAGKIYFDNGYLMVDDGNDAPFSFPLSDIRKVLFSGTTSIETIESDHIRIYPNPATTFLRISNDRNSDSRYQIFSIDGRLLMSGVCKQEETINISRLPKGLYLIKVDGKTFKISKS